MNRRKLEKLKGILAENGVGILNLMGKGMLKENTGWWWKRKDTKEKLRIMNKW